jgi:prophage DNA circulation protein
MTSYFDYVFNASYNGVPFAVTSADSEIGRRLVVHKYPNRDVSYVEDMGKEVDSFDIDGFLVGDNVIALRDFMLTVCRIPGPGLLIHPTYGIKSVRLQKLRIGESVSHGRQIKLHFTFIEEGSKEFPALITSTFNSILGKITNLIGAANVDFLTGVADQVSKGAAVVQEGVQTVLQFTALGGGLVKTATNLFNVASSLVGSFGRFAGGNSGSGTGSITGNISSVGGVTTQLTALIEFSAAAQTAVSDAAINLTAVASSDSTAGIGTAIQEYTTALQAAIPNPGDAVSIFSQMLNFPQPVTTSTASIGLAQNIYQSAITDICRRNVLCALAQSCAIYQPTSYNDAQNLRTSVCALFDAEIEIAGDQGQDETYLALKALRAAVVADLTARGANLAPIVDYKFKASMPALALAYQLYQDTSRTDQLIAFANPPHPAFMPVEFEALAS